MEEGTIFASMTECRNALVTYCINVERTFKVDKSDQVRYRVHCPTEGCPWRMLASKMRNSTNVQVKVNPFKHTCQESTLRKDTISRAKSRWVAEEVKKWVKENQQVGPKELQKNIKDKFKIDLPYIRLFSGKQHAMDSIYGNWLQALFGY
uniref:Transposase MuDR plant domain-containing protein n=1 Tax=Aegilops tauschii subsp. strangulata TaxID=200361 RepID=A0A452ZR89_AEGTS